MLLEYPYWTYAQRDVTLKLNMNSPIRAGVDSDTHQLEFGEVQKRLRTKVNTFFAPPPITPMAFPYS